MSAKRRAARKILERVVVEAGFLLVARQQQTTLLKQLVASLQCVLETGECSRTLVRDMPERSRRSPCVKLQPVASRGPLPGHRPCASRRQSRTDAREPSPVRPDRRDTDCGAHYRQSARTNRACPEAAACLRRRSRTSKLAASGSPSAHSAHAALTGVAACQSRPERLRHHRP